MTFSSKTFSKFAVAGLAAVGGLVSMCPGLASASTTLPPLPSSAQSPQYGALIANPSYETNDYNAGLRLEIVSLNWGQWEPTAGSFSASYEAQEVSIVNGYLAAGFTVGINPGLNTAPAWVSSAPGTSLVDQNGNNSGTPSYEYSAQVRSYLGAYLNNLVATLPTSTYYMIGYGTNTEVEYPSTSGGQWWAFDSNAQGTTSGVVPSVGVSPMPGWVPGTTTYQGQTVTTAQVQGWYNWYLGADINLAQWEMSTVRSAGFNGYFQLKMPGDGANPWVYNYRISTDLAATSHDPYNSMNVGQVWQTVIPALAAPGVVVNVTSVGDGSGTPADNACTAADASVNWQTNSAVNNWSSVRWQTYLAGQSGLPVIGESVGQNSAADMTHDLGLVQACGLIGLEWAFDYQLYGGQYASITNYATDLGVPTFPAVGLSMSSYTFSTRAVGTTSAPLIITVQDTGTAPLTISADGIANPAFTITTDTCAGQTIAAGATSAVSLTFTPQAWGTVTSALTFTTNASDSPESVALAGGGVGPTVSVSPSSGLNLGIVAPGVTTPPSTVTVKNSGSSPLHVGTVTKTGSGFALASNTCTGTAVAPGATCTLGVTFHPTTVGPFTGSLQFSSDANNSPTTIALTGTGGAPAATPSQSSYAFGTTKVGVTTSPFGISIKDTGNLPLQVTSTNVTGPFAITADACSGQTLAVGASCKVSFTFTPTAVGTNTGTLNYVDAAGTQTVSLSGTGS